MPEWLIPALFSGVVSGLVAWATVRVEMRYLKIAIEAAHDRLDAIGAPPAKVRL